jgi:23S rRNA (guanosine2251-2'-O)-methyltransferase
MALIKKTMADLQRLPVELARSGHKLPVTILLENIRSGLNIGSVFRTADAMQAEHIILTGISVMPPHREILKTALDATRSVPWSYYPTTLEAISDLRKKGYHIAGIEQVHGSISLEKFDIPGRVPLALLFGNEVNGLEDTTLAACDSGLEIPQAGSKHSLNISVCAGIILWACYSSLALKS